MIISNNKYGHDERVKLPFYRSSAMNACLMNLSNAKLRPTLILSVSNSSMYQN